MSIVYDHVGMSTVTTGTGTLTLGSALGAVNINAVTYQSFAQAGVPNGAIVSYLILDSNGNWEVGQGIYTSLGTTLSRTVVASSNSNNPISLSGSAQVFITILAEDVNIYRINSAIPLARSYLAGMQLSNDGTSPNTVLDISGGQCRDSTNTFNIIINTFTKSTGGSWTSGSGSNGMGAGLTIAASTWYHVFAIVNNNAADIYFDTSATAANAPSGTTAFRRLGSFKTDASSNILAFTQNGDMFLWVAPLREFNGQSIAAANTLELITLNVPTGVKVRALFSAEASASVANTALGFFSPDITTAPVYFNQLFNTSSGATQAGQFDVQTNTSGQINYLANTTSQTFALGTFGWIDRRGRDN